MTFEVREGQFWINDEPQLIQAGEFHYFRTPVDQWEHRLGLLQNAGFNTVACYIPWLWHQPQSALFDLDGHSHPMRDLAGFLDLATEMGFYIIPRPGPYIMAETINEGIPQWVFDDYPEVAFISQDGKPQNIVSYLHPDFLSCVEAWYEAVFAVLSPRQISRGGKIIMVQLDNEMAMIQWVRNIVDLNPYTLEQFAIYLNHAYKDNLQQHYPGEDLRDFLRDQLSNPQEQCANRVIEDYRHFYRTYLRHYMTLLVKYAKAQGMDVPPIVNIHGYGNGGKTFPIGLSQLVEVMEMDGMVSATDVYPIFIGEGNFHQHLMVNEMTKALQNPEQALFSIEFQAGGNQDFGGAQSSLYDLHTRLCVSVGMRAINHYLFFDGENHPALSPVKRHNWGHPVRKDGSVRKHYKRYPELSQVLSAYGTYLVKSKPKTITTIGFLLDYYMTEVNNNFTRSATDILTHQRDVILFDFIARGLALTHRPFAALELSRATLDIEQTPTLWVMMEKQCNADTQQKLIDYVHQGGKLILVGRICEETYFHVSCTILKDAIGIEAVDSAPPFTQTEIQAFDYSDVPVSFMETYTGDFDDVFASSSEGKTVGFIKNLEKGQVMMLGAAFATNTLDDLDILNQMANKMGCPPLFTMSEWADIRLSEGKNGSFVFVNNYQDDPIETVIQVNDKPMFGVHALELPARRGLILPIEWHIKPGIIVHYLTSEVIEITDEGTRLLIKTKQDKFFAGISVSNYHPAESLVIQEDESQRFTLHGENGIIELHKNQ